MSNHRGTKPMQFTASQVARLRGPETSSELARAFGCSDWPIRKWRADPSHGWVKPSKPKSATYITRNADVGRTTAEGPSEEDLLRDEVKRLRGQLRRSDKDTVGEERVLRAIETAVGAYEPLRAVRPNWPALTRSSGHDQAHHRHGALWSDWHAGEVVKRNQMGGLSVEFNWQVLEDRVNQLVTSMLAFQKVSPALTGLDIFALGDMASGFIHGLDKTNDVVEYEQYVKVGGLMAEALSHLAPHYENIYVSAIVGNHPRADKEPASKDAFNNGDWVAYEFARALTLGLDNVTWDIPRGGMVVRQFGGRNFLLWHGDGVRSSMPGVPWGGIMRRVAVLKETFAEEGIRIDKVVVGHFHQRCVVPHVYMNGSLIGPNQYGLKNFGGGEAPKQLIVEYDEKRKRETAIKTVSFEATK